MKDLRAWSFGISVAGIVISLGGACTSGLDDVGSSRGALHGAGSTPDTSFTSVVMMDTHGFCSGTLLSDSTALMAAHCVTSLAQRCVTEGQELSSNGGVNGVPDDIRLSLNGRSTLPTDVDETYTIDQIVPHPRGFFNVSTCNQTATFNCGNIGSNDNSPAHVTGYDLALVHFVVGAGQFPPSHYNVPIRPVVTSVTDTASSPAGTVHVNLNLTTAITSSTDAWDMGWGNDDNVGGGLRLIAPEQFLNTGSTFGQNCDGWFTCSGAINPNVSCGSPLVTGNFADTAFHTQRWGSPGSATGGGLGSGDSGGPVFIHAGTGSGDVNDTALIATPGGPYFQIAVNVGGTCDTGDGVPIGGAQCNMWFAPTWAPENGSWIDGTLTHWATDIDSDGVKTGQDNCPTVANAYQDNTNILAEQALSDTPAGDACDVNATTRGTPGGDWNSPVTGPCTQVEINANQTFTLSGGGMCPVVYNTAITLRGNIGNATGTAQPASGSSIPSYCDCQYANSSDSYKCSDPNIANCVIASDQADPYVNPKTTGWLEITQRLNGADDYPFTWTTLQHQDPSDSNIATNVWTNQDQTVYWNYMLDTTAAGHGGATSLLGQIWTHLPPSNFSPQAGEMQPAVNRPSHYTDLEAFQRNGFTFGTAPPLINRFVPFWVKVISSGPEVPYLLPGNEASGAMHVVSESAGGLLMADERFDGFALSALYSVATHTSDLLVADEAVAGDGALPSTATRAIVTYVNDTSIQAGLSRPYQTFTATQTQNAGTSFAASVRAYSATSGQLYALKRLNGGWKLYAFDVTSALAGSPTSTHVAITGVSGMVPPCALCANPSTPLAMAYNVRDGNLYVVDQLTVGSQVALRLFRVSTSGSGVELWRTTPDSSLPSTYLSVSPIGELVLGLGTSQSNEVVLLDTNGYVSGSTSATGLLLVRPVANESGISILHTDSAGRAAMPTLFVARSSLTNGICGTTWLQAHVNTTAWSPLGDPAGDCP